MRRVAKPTYDGSRIMTRIDAIIPLVEEILAPWQRQLGADGVAYRHHVYRMVHFCFALRARDADIDDDERRRIVIAGCFHDLGIWSDGTVDYLPPSVARARAYLEQNGLARWSDEIARMIEFHHKLRRCTDPRYPLVEVFRKGDLIDVSLGLVTCGLPRDYIHSVKQQFPNAGFHKRLARLIGGWVPRHPTSPLPFFRW
jgi:hypothetical protein